MWQLLPISLYYWFVWDLYQRSFFTHLSIKQQSPCSILGSRQENHISLTPKLIWRFFLKKLRHGKEDSYITCTTNELCGLRQVTLHLQSTWVSSLKCLLKVEDWTSWPLWLHAVSRAQITTFKKTFTCSRVCQVIVVWLSPFSALNEFL